MPDTIVTQLAKFATQLRFENIDPKVVDKAKQLMLDQLGVAIGCSMLPWNKGLTDYVRLMDGHGKCTVFGHGLKTNLEYAVLANATFGHGFELDDYCPRETVGHLGSLLVPVVTGLVEMKPFSGKKLLEAFIAGYEVMCAVARGIEPSSHFDRGFHAQSVNGPFASATAAGVLLGEDVPTLANAFSLAASHSGGLMEYANNGGNVKRLHAGMAAMGGVRSALLAQYGWSGPPTAIEGKRGFCQAFAAEYKPSAIMEGLGTDFWIASMALKPYSCNGNNVPVIDAMRAILAENPLKPEQIQSIEVHHRPKALKSIAGIGPEPPDIVGAQFSAHFSLAMTVVKGANDFNTLLNVNLKDPLLISVARKVTVVPDKQAEEEEKKGKASWARVIVTTTDGRKFDKAQHAKGSPDNPMSQAEVEAKFSGLAQNVLKADKATKIIEFCRNLESVKDVSEISQYLAK